LEDARRRKRKVCKGEAVTEGTTGRSTELCSTCEKLRGKEGQPPPSTRQPRNKEKRTHEYRGKNKPSLTTSTEEFAHVESLDTQWLGEAISIVGKPIMGPGLMFTWAVKYTGVILSNTCTCVHRDSSWSFIAWLLVNITLESAKTKPKLGS
jgi:hypothetical protein